MLLLFVCYYFLYVTTFYMLLLFIRYYFLYVTTFYMLLLFICYYFLYVTTFHMLLLFICYYFDIKQNLQTKLVCVIFMVWIVKGTLKPLKGSAAGWTASTGLRSGWGPARWPLNRLSCASISAGLILERVSELTRIRGDILTWKLKMIWKQINK